MKRPWPVEELARDERFARIPITDMLTDPRTSGQMKGNYELPGRLVPDEETSPERARQLMHGIFMGEVQALEGAGRTCFDFDDDEVPLQLKLDMARQTWDESRHVEISIKLIDWMGTEVGEFAESTFLYEAACNPDPVMRLTGVNRALEGLAIDVFNTMRDFGQRAGDPVLAFCEDWMLADEVTHVKMGSDWLRRLTEHDPDRRARALEFQRVIDKLFSLGGFRSENDESPVSLAQQFRSMAGFSDSEIQEIVALSDEALEEAKARA
jgi:uncharacterized ferritin-like protein (DUF455 family)